MLDLGSPTFVSSYRLWSDNYVGTVKSVTVSGSMTPSFEDPIILDEPQASTYVGNFNSTQTFLVSHPAVARYVMFDFSDYTGTERVSEVMVNPEGIMSPGVVAEYPVPAPAAHAAQPPPPIRPVGRAPTAKGVKGMCDGTEAATQTRNMQSALKIVCQPHARMG